MGQARPSFSVTMAYDPVEDGLADQEPLTSVPIRQGRGRIAVLACCTLGLMGACFAGGYHVGHRSAMSTADVQEKWSLDAKPISAALLKRFDKTATANSTVMKSRRCATFWGSLNTCV